MIFSVHLAVEGGYIPNLGMKPKWLSKLKFQDQYARVAERSIAMDCKSIDLWSTKVQILPRALLRNPS